MLKALRKKERAKKIILWAICGVMVLAFVLWGAEAHRQRSGPDYAGIIFGRKVSIPEFRRIYVSCLNDMRLRLGEDYQKLLPIINLNHQSWMKLALLHHARKLKIRAANPEVVAAITANPFFFRDGKFNRETYEKIVRYYFRSSPRAFEEQTRDSLIIKKLYDELTKNVTITDEELLNAYKQEFEELSINYIQLKTDDLLAQVTLEDAELKDYYQKNAIQLKMPPAVKAEYLAGEYPEDAKEEEKIKRLDEIKALYPKIKNTADLKTIARENLIYRQTGFFSLYEPIEKIESLEFNKWAFQLREKQTSPVIQTPWGVYVLRVMQKRDSYIPDFQDAKEKVAEALKADKAKEAAKKQIQEYKNKIDEFIKNNPGGNLREAVKSLGLEVKTTAQFRRGRPLEESGISQNIQNIAFTLKPGQISDTLEADSAYFLIEQDKLTGIDEEKFKEEKEAYAKDLLEKKKDALFNSALQELMAKSGLIDYSSLLDLPQ